MLIRWVSGVWLLVGMASAGAIPARSRTPVWEFGGTSTDGWSATRHVEPLSVDAGSLRVRTIGHDPGIQCSGLAATVTGATWIELRLRATSSGNGQVFWFGDGGGAPGSAGFHVPGGDGEWLELAVFPGWGGVGRVERLRVDVYHSGEGCSFEIDRVALREWRPGGAARTDAGPWVFAGDDANADWASWLPTAHADVGMSPRLNLGADPGGWVSLTLSATRDCVPAIVWVEQGTGSVGRQPFPVRGDGTLRRYSIQLAGHGAWRNPPELFGLHIPLIARDAVAVESLAFADDRAGPADLVVDYLGFENAPVRAGRSCRVLSIVRNVGGTPAEGRLLRLDCPAALHSDGPAPAKAMPRLAPGRRCRLGWTLRPAAAGRHQVVLREPSAAGGLLARSEVEVLPALEARRAAYVPEPQPVTTEVDIFAFYFPGWDSPAKWAPIRAQAPERKPVLGWYDESNPECVDWQIKWAVENGITGFVLDWYWNDGRGHLDHWLKAYRRARYRDLLKLFVLWCDHKATDVRSLDDMRRLARHWVDDLFSLESYYRIDGRPVVAVFAPGSLRTSLGGSEGVRAALDSAQTMAREAGHPGILFLSSGNNFGAGSARQLAAEGYGGATTYHEVGTDYHDCPNQQMRSYRKQVSTVPAAWRRKVRSAPDFRYLPVVDSGWDSRPWHGWSGSVVHGRTVPLFETWLREGREFCREHEIDVLVLGPLNEWGEGSYLEPCTEFGFGMYEAVRRVFAEGAPESWPRNLGPRDVGLGPYGLDMTAGHTRWGFDAGSEGWSAGMGCAIGVDDGTLRIQSTTDDPALTCAVGVEAREIAAFVVRMRCSGGTPKPNYAQVFWATEDEPISGKAVLGFLFDDGPEFREYRVDVAAHPRWRGRVVQLRFDPCCEEGVLVEIDEMRLEPAGSGR